MTSALTVKERVTIVQLFYQEQGKHDEIGIKWAKHHRKRAKPGKEIISSVVAHFEKTGSVKYDVTSTLDPVTGEMLPYEETILGPYMIQTLLHYHQPDSVSRLAIAQYLLENDSRRTIPLESIWFTGQATLSIDGYAYRAGYRFWGSERPEYTMAFPLDDTPIIHVYAALCGTTILGPYFSSGPFDELTYMHFLQERIFKDIDTIEREMDDVDRHWMQDVPDHLKTERVSNFLRDRWGDQMFADKANLFCGYGFDWPNFSPDLNPIDFFLWGYMKDRIDLVKPASYPKFEETIIHVFEELRDNPNLINRNFDILRDRLDKVVKAGGWGSSRIIA